MRLRWRGVTLGLDKEAQARIDKNGTPSALYKRETAHLRRIKNAAKSEEIAYIALDTPIIMTRLKQKNPFATCWIGDILTRDLLLDLIQQLSGLTCDIFIDEGFKSQCDKFFKDETQAALKNYRLMETINDGYPKASTVILHYVYIGDQ